MSITQNRLSLGIIKRNVRKHHSPRHRTHNSARSRKGVVSPEFRKTIRNQLHQPLIAIDRNSTHLRFAMA